tara:strand:+ start:6273 stop:7241 length:969 start_codon:yes stop_codon:yes gene_type:complete
MITSRPSNDILHTDTILEKITEFDIFRYYCSVFIDLNKKFCSELREDRKPSASVVNYNNNLLYKDFGHPEHTFNCFGYVQFKYGITFTDALVKISSDFNLRLAITNGATQSKTPKLYGKQIVDKKVTIIKIKVRDWDTNDANFWKPFNISKKILCTFVVKPISYYWINENRFKAKTPTYAFRFNNKFKIYAPYETDIKWFSNTNKEIIQGYNQLPEKGNILYITSSLKDIMSLYAMQLHAVAFQSEMQMPSKLQMQVLQERFKKIVIFYDNDPPGQTMAKEICRVYQLDNLCIPSDWNAKDISDAIAVYGFDKVKNHFTNEI